MAARPPRSTNFWILPVAVFGSSATNVKLCGHLKCASRSRANARSSSAVTVAPSLQHDERVRRLAPLLVRQADDRRFLHRGMAQQHALDLDRRDVLAAADDHVLEAVADLDVAVRMDDRGVAGVEPAAAQRRAPSPRDRCSSPSSPRCRARRSRRRVWPSCGTSLPVLVDDAQLARRDQLDALARLDRRPAPRGDSASCSGRGSQTVMNGAVSVRP